MLLLQALRGDPGFARASSAACRCCSMLPPASAGDLGRIDRLALRRRLRERVPWVTGLGATETAPFALCTARADRSPAASACPRPASS